MSSILLAHLATAVFATVVALILCALTPDERF